MNRIDKAREDGTLKRAGEELAKAYMLFTIANQYFEACADIVKNSGLTLTFIPKYVRGMQYNFDLFCHEMRSMMGREEKNNFASDFDHISKEIDKLFK